MDAGGARCEVYSERRTLVDVHILVVDDDATSLAVVSAMLRVCRYQVVTLRNPIEALHTLRARKGYFDLVVTDLHMPQMNGLQLQKQVNQEFKIPVIMMSADEKPSVILKSLEEGVAFYMVKPISLDDLKHVWQYAITAKKVTPNQTTTTTIVGRVLSNEKSSFKETSTLAPRLNEEKCAKSKNKKAKENRVIKNSIANRKAKVVWTNSLHNRFLQAIRQLGLDKAVPKRILEFMSVPGLTRENVASHLQKYRIFLKRVAEKGARSLKGCSEYRLLRSSFASAHFPPQLYREKFQSQYQYFPENHQMAPSLSYHRSILGGNLSPLGPPKSNLEGVSMESSLARLGNQQSSLLTKNKPGFAFNGLISTWTRNDQNSVFLGNENPRFSRNGMGKKTREDSLSCSGQNGLCNIQAQHDLNNGVLSFNGGYCASVGKVEEPIGDKMNGGGAFSGLFDEGTDQLLQMISGTNMQGKKASVLVPSEEEPTVNPWQAADDTATFGDFGKDRDCFDVLSEIFIDKKQNRPSLREEEVVDTEEDLSDIWNEIEMEALQPSGLSAQDWDCEILEVLFGDGSL